jgi:hypothetical protein
MTLAQQAIICYLIFWPIRINGCIRRGRQAQMRGPEWFLNVRVKPGFYEGEGKKLLHRYWLRMLLPFALDIPAATFLFATGRYFYLNLLVVTLALMIHVNHAFNVRIAQRQAGPFAVEEAEQPVPSMVLSLRARRLRDYTNWRLEIMIAMATIAATVWLLRIYLAAPDHHNLRLVFGVPLFELYLQIGMLFAKFGVVAWRTPIPQVQAEEHMKVREESRKLYLKICDQFRMMAVVAILIWPVILKTDPGVRPKLLDIYFLAGLAVSLIQTVWFEIERKRMRKLALLAEPRTLPNFLGQASGWPVCYQPSIPILLLRNTRGYSVNLANRMIQIGAVYLAGFFALILLLTIGR